MPSPRAADRDSDRGDRPDDRLSPEPVRRASPDDRRPRRSPEDRPPRRSPEDRPLRRGSPEGRPLRRSPEGRPVRRSPEPRGARRSPEPRGLRRSPDPRDSRDPRDARDPRDFRDARRSRERRDSRDPRDVRDSRRSPPRRSPEGRGVRRSIDRRRSPDPRAVRRSPPRRSPEPRGRSPVARRRSPERDDRRPPSRGRRDYPPEDRRPSVEVPQAKRPRYELPSDPLPARLADDRFDPLAPARAALPRSPDRLRPSEEALGRPVARRASPGLRDLPLSRDPFEARPVPRDLDRDRDLEREREYAERDALLRMRELELIRRERALLAGLRGDPLRGAARDLLAPLDDDPLRPRASRAPLLDADLRDLALLRADPYRDVRREVPREPRLPSPVRLEREVEALHKERDAAQMLERYGEAKRLGVRPSRQTSLFLLSALAMSSSPALVGRIYDAVFEDRELVLTPEQYHNVFIALSSAAMPARVMDLYHQMHSKGVPIKNPQTFQVIIPCAETPEDAVLLFQDLKESGLRPTHTVCHALLQVAIPDKAKAKVLLDEMQTLDVSPNKVLELMKSKEAWDLLELATSVEVEEPLWLQLLKEPEAVDAGRLLAIWKRSPALQRPPCATAVLDAIMREPDVARAADLMMDALRHLKATKQPIDDTAARFVMKLLAAQKDQRIFALYKDLKRLLQPDHAIFLAVLSVAAHHYSAAAAKEMWRDMHAQNLMPKTESLRFMLEASSKDAQACGEIMDVIAQSNLPFPPGSEAFLLGAFEHSEELRRRLPQLRQLFPNSTDPRLAPAPRSRGDTPPHGPDDTWLTAGPHVGSQRVRHF
eukprot:EG_transcript_2233